MLHSPTFIHGYTIWGLKKHPAPGQQQQQQQQQQHLGKNGEGGF